MNGFPYSSDIRVTIREHPLGSGPYPSFEEPPSGDVPPGIFKPHVTNDFASAASTNATTTPSMLSPTSAGAARFGALIEN
jgi:hypothetical protein